MDVLLIFLAIGLVSLIFKKINWVQKPTLREYILLISITLFIAGLNEIINLKLEVFNS